MTRSQRITILIAILIFLFVGGRFWLFAHLKKNPNELATTIQAPTESIDTGNSSPTPGDTTDEQPNETETPHTEPLGSTAVTPVVFTGVLTVLLPPRFSQQSRTELSTTIQTQTSLQARSFQPKTLAAYLKAITIMSTGTRQADIMLIPRNERTSLHGGGAYLSRENSPAPFLHPQLASLLQDKQLTFFPYAIDPRVTFVQQPASSSLLTLAKLLQQIKFAQNLIPLDISAQTIAQIATQQEPRPRFFRLLTIRLDQTAQVDSPEVLSLLLQSANSGNPVCFDTTTCLAEHEELYALRLPLSQAENDHLKPGSMHITNFPSLTDTYPADVRGWVVNKHSPYLPESVVWIQSYLELLVQDQTPYHDRLLPVLQGRFQRLLLQPQRQRLAPLAYRFDWLTTSTMDIANKLALLPLREFIEGTYHPGIFLNARLKK